MIPNVILLAGSIAGLAVVVATDPASSGPRYQAAAAGGLLLVFALAYPRGMGMGDVKLAAVMGLYLGSAVAPALLIAVLAGTLVGGGVILSYGTGARKVAVPFGPFLALGGVIALLVGPELIGWYLNAFVR